MKSTTAACQCGRVEFQFTGEPIVRAACFCNSCRDAGETLAQAPGAPRVVDPDGGTDFLLYRKDRVTLLAGGERLVAHRLKPDSPTRRMVAGCCNTPMLLDFSRGHWVSVFRGRLPALARPLELRVMTAQRPQSVPLPKDVPNLPGHSGKFMWKIIAAWAGMGFRKPKVAW